MGPISPKRKLIQLGTAMSMGLIIYAIGLYLLGWKVGLGVSLLLWSNNIGNGLHKIMEKKV